MSKRIILFFLFIFLLSSCKNRRSFACTRYLGQDSITVNITAINDDIETIQVTETFVLPYDVIADEKKMNFINKQIDKSYHFEENRLIRQYALTIDDRYSLNKTLEQLKDEKYFCE